MVLKKTALFLYIMLMVAGCQPPATQKETVKYIQPHPTEIEDSLNNYFSRWEIEPRLVINNIDENQTTIRFANHTINWLNTAKETRVKIDNDLISLKGKFTLNKVAFGNADEVDFANNWDQIKYFACNGNEEEIVIIRMGFDPCTGMACGVNYFLVYDLHRKAKSFFGTFRSDDAINLYGFNQVASSQSGYYYLSKSYAEELPRAERQVSTTYELFALVKDGEFLLQRDTKGQPYYIKHTFSEEDTSAIRETMNAHWFEKIK